MSTEKNEQLLSAAQKQLLAGQLLAPEIPMCNMALACAIDGLIDPLIMIESWNEVARQYDALTVRIDISDSEVTQSAGHQPPAMELADLSQQPAPDELVQRQMQQLVSTAIDPESVLGCVRLFKLAPDRWIFFCNLHHIICDARSFAVLWRRLSSTYSGHFKSGTTTVDNEAVLGSFFEYIEAATQRVTSAARPDHITELKDIAPPAPFARRPDRTDTSSTRVSLPLSSERTATLAFMATLPQVRGFGQGIGNCNVLLTLLVALMYRIGGGSVQTIGLPLPQRQNPAFQDMVGLMIEVLPLQIEIDEHSTFESLMQQVRASFMRLLKDSGAGDSAQLEAQAIPTLLNYINAPLGDFGELPAKVQWLHSGHIDSQHLLRLQVEDWAGDGKITLSFDFNDAVFDNQRRSQTIGAFWNLFDAMSESLSRSVEGVAITNVRTLKDPNYQNLADNNPHTIFERIIENSHILKDRKALTEGEKFITYGQLGARIRHIAQQLNNACVGRGDRVAVFLHRDIQLPQVLLAIHACAAAYVPLDANQPVQRVLQILDDADAVALITSVELGSEIKCSNKLYLDTLLDGPEEQEPDTNTNIAIKLPTSTDTAYLMYTSGTSGTPKGVSVTHESLANYCMWAAGFYANHNSISMALFTPVGFDLTVTALFLPLITGGELHVYCEEKYVGVEALAQLLSDDLVDVVKLTPAHLGTLTREQCVASKRLSQLIVGGEDLTTSLAARIHSLFGGRVKIHNEYGPTEATVGCVLHTFDAEVDQQASVPIGQAIANCNLRILNAAGQDQLPGCAGELHVAGASLAKGYWQQSELANKKFINLAPDGTRYFRTGDLVREASDGKLYCLGRTDNQLKIRGHRIEPAEIESVALEHPAVKACVAVLSSPDIAVQSEDRKCRQCGLSSRVPGAELDESGLCMPCRNFYLYRDRVNAYFRPMQEFHDIVSAVKDRNNSEYDCIMLLSGGKDSTYALAQLVDMGLHVLAFTLDNGFISQSAKDNATRVCESLGVTHRYGRTEAMNSIFLDSLQRHSNVCNGCFKTIYTMALELAVQKDIDCIVTGLSRGQFFETRLSEDWFMAPDYRSEAMDDAIIAARKAYHRIEDAVSCGLNTEFLKDDSIFERIKIVDFYRYSDVNLDEMYRYLDTRLPWVRPADTGRSTNCLINDTGIYIHKRERGFHNYAHPYSWDVRLGHKRREAALEELDDEIDESTVMRHLDEIGYQVFDKEPERIALYYTCNSTLNENELRGWLATHLPDWMTPAWLIELPSLPLSLNGKVDRMLLPAPTVPKVWVTTPNVPRALAGNVDGKVIEIHRETDQPLPQTEQEQLVARVWSRHLRIEPIGIHDNFFALGGDSLMAIRITSELNRSGYAYQPADIFENQTIAKLARIECANQARNAPFADKTQMTHLGEKSDAFSSLSESQIDALSRVLNKNREE